MEELLLRISWRMPVYGAGSLPHLTILAATIGLAAMEVHLLKKRINETRLLFAAGCVLALMEVIKQLLLTYVRAGSYSWSDLPFQLCSMPMYIMFVYPLCGKRGRAVLRRFLMTFGLLGGIAALVEPVSLFTDVVLLTMHAFMWHIALILVGLLCAVVEIRSLPADAKLLHSVFQIFRPAGRLYLCLAAVAVLLNAALQKVSGGTCNMFFLGPSQPEMYFLDDIWLYCGWVAETLFFVALTWAAGLGVTALLTCFHGSTYQNQT